MGIFSSMLKAALFSHEYICDECGERMEFEDENESILVCPNCGNSMELEHYGLTDEEYNDLYPSEDEFDEDY